MTDTGSADFFEAKYKRDLDPWHFETSAYEQARYDTIMRALGGRRYARGFEPGCSVGALTVRLARLCDHLHAIDVSPTAVARAQQRCAPCANVHLAVGSLADPLREGAFELVVLSEVGYYFPEAELSLIGRHLVAHLEPGGVLLAAHWLGHSADHRLSGDRVHEILSALSGLEHAHADRLTGFRLDCWRRE